MESVANAATACCGCSSQGRLRTLDSETKPLSSVDTGGVRSVERLSERDLTSSFKTCM